MATGSQTFDTPRSRGYTLLDGETSTTDGVWVDTADLMEIGLHLKIGTSATVQICGSNEDPRPANSTHGFSIGTALTADDMSLIVPSPRWVKARLTAVSGACSAWIVGRKPNR